MRTTCPPARHARAFVRTQRFALASLSENTPAARRARTEETVRIAFSAEGSVLLSNDAPPVGKRGRSTRLLVGTRRCHAILEGRLLPHFDPLDRQRFDALHPDFAMKWVLEPDVVIWRCVERGPHAFLAAEWLIEAPAEQAKATDLAASINALHPRAVETLIEEHTALEPTGARVVHPDAEGLLVESRGVLAHLPFETICRQRADAVLALRQLLRNLQWASGASVPGEAPDACDRLQRSSSEG